MHGDKPKTFSMFVEIDKDIARGSPFLSFWMEGQGQHFPNEESPYSELEQALQKAGKARPITTETRPAADFAQYGGIFYYGEDYHQQASVAEN